MHRVGTDENINFILFVKVNWKFSSRHYIHYVRGENWKVCTTCCWWWWRRVLSKTVYMYIKGNDGDVISRNFHPLLIPSNYVSPFFHTRHTTLYAPLLLLTVFCPQSAVKATSLSAESSILIKRNMRLSRPRFSEIEIREREKKLFPRKLLSLTTDQLSLRKRGC